MSEGAMKDEELKVLFHAAKLGRTDIVQHAVSTLKEKDNLSQESLAEIISTPDSDGATALHIAAFNGHADVVRSLLNLGALCTVSFEYGGFSFKTPYEVANHSAIQAFHVYLLEQIAMGHSSIIEDLVSSGIPADLSDDSDTGDTTLHWAISFNNIDAAQMLLNLGVPVDVVNKQGKTCLHLACQASNKLIIELLLNWGADTTLEDDNGKLPVDYVKSDKGEIRDLLSTPVEDVQRSPVKLKNRREDREEDAEERDGSSDAGSEIGSDEQEESSRKDVGSSVVDSTGSYVMLGSHAQSPSGPLSASGAGEIQSFRNNTAQKSGDKDEDESRSGSRSSSCMSSSSTSSLSSTDPPQLILWPPAQRQCQHSREQPHVISLDRPLLISCDGSFQHILDSTRLVSTLRGVGVQTEVRTKTSGWHSDCNLRLCIDSHICPGRHSFDIDVTSHCIRLIAADETGLLYAVNTFVQILKLHSDYITNSPATGGVESNSLVVNFIKIPSMTIHDWPNVANRGVMWTSAIDIRTKFDHMKDFVVFMSEVRMNQLFMRIDCDDKEGGAPAHGGEEEEVEDGYRSGLTEQDDYYLELMAMDEMSHQHCIEFIPTIVITSTDQKIPSVVLKREFLSTTVAVIFQLRDVDGGDVDDDKEDESEGGACASLLQRTFNDLVLAGYKSIILSSSSWMTASAEPHTDTAADTAAGTETGAGTRGGLAKSPARLAVEMGLNPLVYPLDHFFPQSVLSRGLMSTKSHAKPMLQRTKEILRLKHNSSVLLPAMGASDFYYPTILLKHMCFLQAGAAWNHESFEDILGASLDDHSMLRPALSTLLFQTYNPSDADADNSEELLQNTMLDIFTNYSDDHGLTLLSLSCSSHSNLNEQSAPGSPLKAVTRSSAEIEAALWGVVCAPSSRPDAHVPVTKEEAVLTLKRTKGILSSVNWKVVDSKKKGLSQECATLSMLDTEEYMRMLNLLNIVCRTIVMSYNSAQKPALPYRPANPSASPPGRQAPALAALVHSLSPGTSSDLANAILESMTLCGQVWSERLHAKYFTEGGGSDGYWGNDWADDRGVSDLLVERYVRVKRAELPLLAVFGDICKHMPAFTPEVLMKIFDEHEEGVAQVVGSPAVAPVALRWSLWG